MNKQGHGAWILPWIAAGFASAPVSAQQNPFPPSPPASQGVSARALERLAEMVEGFVVEDEIVGAELLVVKNRRTVLHEVFGFLDREDERPMEKNTIFSIRSMTKVITGAAVQMFVDEGKLDVEDTVAKHLDAFDNEKSRMVTLRHLLTHQSGFPMRSAGTLWTNYGSYSDVRQIANYWGRYGPRAFQPGSGYHYADANADTLGAVLWKVSGKGPEELFQERIFDPLGMRDTIPLLRKDDPRCERVASKYSGGTGNWNRFWHWKGKPLFPFTMCAQGLYATPRDYARFLALWMDGGVRKGKRLLSKEAIERALTPTSRATLPTGFIGLRSSYGQMMHLYVDPDAPKGAPPIVFGHSGSDGTYAWAWPAQDLMVLYFTQSRGGKTRTRMETAIDTLIARPVK